MPKVRESQTPGPWVVRVRHARNDNPLISAKGEIIDCFVQAPDVHGYAYDAEVLGDDEYREADGIERKLADCHLIAAAMPLRDALRGVLSAFECAVGNAWPEFAGTRESEPEVFNEQVKLALALLGSLDAKLKAPHDPWKDS